MFYFCFSQDFEYSINKLQWFANNSSDLHPNCTSQHQKSYISKNWCDCVNYWDCPWWYNWINIQQLDSLNCIPECELWEKFDINSKRCKNYYDCNSWEYYNFMIQDCVPSKNSACPIESVWEKYWDNWELLCFCEDGSVVPAWTQHCLSKCPENSFEYKGVCMCEKGYIVDSSWFDCKQVIQECTGNTVSVWLDSKWLQLCRCSKWTTSNLNWWTIIYAWWIELCKKSKECWDNSYLLNGNCECDIWYIKVYPINNCISTTSDFASVKPFLNDFISNLEWLRAIDTLQTGNIILFARPILSVQSGSTNLQDYLRVNRDFLNIKIIWWKDIFEWRWLLYYTIDELWDNVNNFFELSNTNIDYTWNQNIIMNASRFKYLKEGMNWILKADMFSKWGYIESYANYMNDNLSFDYTNKLPPVNLLFWVKNYSQYMYEWDSDWNAFNKASAWNFIIEPIYTIFTPIFIYDSWIWLFGYMNKSLWNLQLYNFVESHNFDLSSINDIWIQQSYLDYIKNFSYNKLKSLSIGKIWLYIKTWFDIWYLGLQDSMNKVYRWFKLMINGIF